MMTPSTDIDKNKILQGIALRKKQSPIVDQTAAKNALVSAKSAPAEESQKPTRTDFNIPATNYYNNQSTSQDESIVDDYMVELHKQIEKDYHAREGAKQAKLEELQSLRDDVVQARYGSAEQDANKLATNRTQYGNPMAQMIAFMEGQSKAVDARSANKQLDIAQLNLNTRTQEDDKQARMTNRPESGMWSDFQQQFRDKPLEDYIPFFAGENGNLNDILEKASKGENLSDTEKQVIKAYHFNQQSQKRIIDQGGATTASQVGRAISGSIPYIAEMAIGLEATGGAITAKTVGGVAKAVAIRLGQMATMTPALSNTHNDYNARTQHQFTIGITKDKDDNEVIQVAKETPTSEWERLYKAYMTGFAGAASESAFTFIPAGYVSKQFGKIVPKLFGAKTANIINNGFAKLNTPGVQSVNTWSKNHLNIGGAIEEFNEEILNNILDPLLTAEPERIKDGFSKENLWVTFLSTSMMTSGFHMMSLPAVIKDDRAAHKAKEKANSYLTSITDNQLKEALVESKVAQTIEQKAAILAHKVDWGKVPPIDVARAVGYLNISTERDVLRGARYSLEAQQKLNTITSEYEEFRNQITGDIQLVRDDSGDVYFLKSGTLDEQDAESDGTVFVMDDNSNVSQRNKSELQELSRCTLGEFLSQKTQTISQEIEQQAQQDSQTEIIEQSQQAGISPDKALAASGGVALDNIEGSYVKLSDGRAVYIEGQKPDKTGYNAKYTNVETGDQEDVTVGINDIVDNLTDDQYDELTSQTTPVQTEQTISKQQPQVESQVAVQPQIPVTKEGGKDYDSMSSDMLARELETDLGHDVAAEELSTSIKYVDSQIRNITNQKGDSINERVKRRAQIQELNTRKNTLLAALEIVQPTATPPAQTNPIVADPVRDAQTPEQKYIAVKQIVEKLNARSGEHVIVPYSIKEIPEALQEGFLNNAEGVCFKGKVYINPNSIYIRTSKNVETTYIHEVAGHLHIKNAIDNHNQTRLFESIVDTIGTNAMLEKDIAGLNLEVQLYEQGENSKSQLGAEYLAYLAGQYFTPLDFNISKTNQLYVNLSNGIDDNILKNILKSTNNGTAKIYITAELGTRVRALQSLDGNAQRVDQRGTDGTPNIPYSTNTDDSDGGSEQAHRTRNDETRSDEASSTKYQRTLSEQDKPRADRVEPRATSTGEIVNDVRFRQEQTSQTDRIKTKAIADGIFLKAPNGKHTNLTEHQWLQVRTKAFKEWFGDWEKAARIEKLRASKPVEISGNEITPAEDLKQYRRNAFEYGKTITGEYTNEDTGVTINLTGGSKSGGLREILHHDYKEMSHLQSIAAIPEIIHKSIFITSIDNENQTNTDIASYDYYVCGLKIRDVDYTVKAVVANSKDGTKYYDHKLTDIEKGQLLTLLEGLSIPSADSNSPLSDIKDKRLISILQNNSSRNEALSEQFSADLQRYSEHKMYANEHLVVGMPQYVISQFLPHTPIILKQSVLTKGLKKHSISIESLKNLSTHINNPIFVFQRDNNTIGILTELQDTNNKNICVAIQMHTTLQRGKSIVEVNNITTIHGRDEANIIMPIIQNNTLVWVNKEKGLDWLSSAQLNGQELTYQDLNSATKIIKDFENPILNVRNRVENNTPIQQEYQQHDMDVNSVLDRMEQRLGVKVMRYPSREDVPRNVRTRMNHSARYTGWYDKSNGQVGIIVGELTDANQAASTYLHEVVAHKGIDGLLGAERAKEFYTAVFNSLPTDDQIRLTDKYDGNKVLAGDEYVARMAEGNVIPSTMQRIISAIGRFFREVLGFQLGISDNDIRYILWKSQRKLEKATTLPAAMDAIAQDKKLRDELFSDVRFRKTDAKPSKDKNGLHELISPPLPLKNLSIERGILKHIGSVIQRKGQDRTNAIKLLQNEILRRGGTVDDNTNIHIALNHSTSKIKAAQEKYDSEIYEPLANAIVELSKKHHLGYAEVELYVMAKSSIEREASGKTCCAREDQGPWTKNLCAQIVNKFENQVHDMEYLESNLWSTLRKATLFSINKAQLSGRISKEVYGKIIGKQWKYYVPLRGLDYEFNKMMDPNQILNFVNTNLEDYSMLDAQIAAKKAKGHTTKPADALAQIQRIAHMEIMLGEQNAVNKVARELIRSNPRYQDLFTLQTTWYVKNAQGEFEPTFNVPSETEIKASYAAEKRYKAYKRALHKMSNDDTVSLAVKEKKIKEYEEEIDSLSKQITVQRSLNTDHPFRGLDSFQEHQMHVVVYDNGIRQVLVFADPVVTNAINGVNKSWAARFAQWNVVSGNWKRKGMRWFGLAPISRFRSQMSTSYNPIFAVNNGQRDARQVFNYQVWDPQGRPIDFLTYYPWASNTTARALRKKGNPLLVSEIEGRNISNKADYDSLVEEFGMGRVMDTLYDIWVVNGGQTGYTHMADVKEYSVRQMKDINMKVQELTAKNFTKKGLSKLGKGIEFITQGSENTTRFATFLSQVTPSHKTHSDQWTDGQSILQSVAYSKNASVNFDFKGEWAAALNMHTLFANAGIQSLAAKYRLFTRNRWSIVGFTLQHIVTGYLSCLVYDLVRDLLGDDDEDMPTYFDRATNYIFPLFGVDVKFTLSHFERAGWAVGVNLYDWHQGRVSSTIAIERSLQSVVDADIPFNLAPKNVWRAITPAALMPLAETADEINTDYRGMYINKPLFPGQENIVPDSRRGKKNTGSLYVWLSEVLNDAIGGGNENTPAGLTKYGNFNALNVLDISPSTMEHIVQGYGGSVSTDAVRTANVVKELIMSLFGEDIDLQANDIPLVRSFIATRRINDDGNQEEYYNAKEYLTTARQSINANIKHKTLPNWAKTTNELKQASKEINKLYRKLKDADDKIKTIKDKMIDFKYGSQQYKNLQQELYTVQREFNKTYYNDNRK